MIAELIKHYKQETPGATRVVLTKDQHGALCSELTQKEGRPTRVYAFDGLRVEIANAVPQ